MAGLRAALRSPLGKPVTLAFAGRAACVMYHRISAGPAVRERDTFHPNLELFVSEDEFEKQMRHLSHHYNCLGLDEAVDLLRERKLPRRSVVVTFDDGYRDNLLALPILDRYRVPATIYITTGAIDRSRSLWWDEQASVIAALTSLELRGRRWDLSTTALKTRAFADLNALFKSMRPDQQDELMTELRAAHTTASGESMLTWSDVIGLDGHPLITIGAHTVDHHVLSQVTAEELRHQLVASREELERRLGHPVRHFAFPFGGAAHAGPREFAAAAAIGFTSAVTTRPGHWRHSSSLHSLPRIAIDYSDSMDDFEWKLSGGYAATERPVRVAKAVATRIGS